MVSFFSMRPRHMRRHMHPQLLSMLVQNDITVGEELKDLNKRSHEILSGLTGIRRTKQSAAALMGGRYVLTGDARPARTLFCFAPRSVRRLLLIPQVNRRSLYRCGKSD